MNEETKAKAAQIYAEAGPLLPIAKIVVAVSDLVDAAEAVLPIGELDSVNEHWGAELDKLEEAVKQIKETFKEGTQSTIPTVTECKYSMGVLCEHKAFPNKPALCDLGCCPLLKDV